MSWKENSFRYHNKSNRNMNYSPNKSSTRSSSYYSNNNNSSKSESTSPSNYYNNNNNNSGYTHNNRYSPKIRNSQSTSMFSPSKSNNNGIRNSLNNSPTKSPTSLNVSTSLLPNLSDVAVPNPFGGSKYHDPPPADILPLPPMQWMSMSEANFQFELQKALSNCLPTSTSTPATSNSIIPPTIVNIKTSSIAIAHQQQQQQQHFRMATAVKA